MKPILYRRKPVEVEALRWTGRNWEAMKKFCPEAQFTSLYLIVPTSTGQMTVESGAYVIKEKDGTFSTMSGGMFVSLHDPV